MQDQIVHTFALSDLNKPVHEMFDTGHPIRTKRITVMTESAATCKMPGSDTGYFVTTASGSRYTPIVLPLAALFAWMLDCLGIVDPKWR